MDDLDATISSRGQSAGEEREPRPSRFSLVVVSHPDSAALGRWHLVPKGARLTVGRDPETDISFPEVPEVSRRHALIWEADGAVKVRDLGSTNGTLVNGEKISGEHSLGHLHRIQLASVQLKFFDSRVGDHTYLEAIFDLAVRDPLTAAYNRRKLDDELGRELACVKRYERAVSLVLLDVDGFKGVNDRQGHLAGDALLQQVVELVSPLLRREAIFARFGGDEFVILCPESGSRGAVALAERLRRRIAEHPFRLGNEEIHVTCSFGVAPVAPTMERPRDVYALADSALYAAKRQGGNAVVAAEEPPPDGPG